jgi:dipeptidyl aminopeptidase/acylaminoacyl peptidase
MKSAARLLCVLAPLLACVLPAHASFTLEQVMKAPFASELTAAPTGERVAWVLFEQGRRNIYVAEAAAWKGRKVTAFNDDDGQEIDHMAWAPDGSALYFARGGDFEMRRDNPNPAVRPEKPDQSVWVVKLDGSPARKLGEGNSPAVSPRGDIVAFLRGGQVYRMAPDGSDAKSIVNAKGSIGDLTWSPDGSQLAFVNDRKTHGFIGVYRVADNTLHYMDPSVDHDLSPVWSPDGSRIAFLRIPTSSRAFAFGPVREVQPFSIRIADAASGVGHEIWRADAGEGSAFHEIVADKQVLWGTGNRLVFPWEKTGWECLYSVSVDGGPAALLTPGDAMVEHVALSHDRGTIYFSTNRDDIDRRHIWKVEVGAEGRPTPVTSGRGIEWSPEPVADGSALAYLASDAQHKSHAVVRLGSADARDLAPETVPADFPAAQLIVPQQVILSASDGMQIHGQLFLPREKAGNAKHPAIVFFHGGSRRQMLLGFHYMYYYSNAYSMNEYLASLGYVVLSVNYRSGIGYGMKFREALNYGATGASEFNDVMGAGLYLRSRPDVDPQRIGVWGGSYGGYLTALALARSSDLFKAGVDFHGVHDWNDVIHNFVPSYNPQEQAEAARVAFASSPLASMDTWRSPVLLIQGDDDRNVPFDETVHLAEALRTHKIPFELMVLPDEIHDFLLYRSWMKSYAATADFLSRKLEQDAREDVTRAR